MATFTGEVHKQDFFYIDNDPTEDAASLDILTNPFAKCCFKLNVYASTSDTDTYKNDKTAFLYRFPLSVTSCTLTLQKKESGTWTDKATLNNNTYGTFYAFGFARKGTPQNDLIGYYLDWRTVLSAFGVGYYRIKRTFSSVDRFSEAYCLHSYTAQRVDRTTRVKFIQNSIIGDSNNSKLTVDFSNLEWESMIRIPKSMFGFVKSDYSIETVRYESGFQRDFENNQSKRYIWEIRGLDYITHKVITDQVLQADEIYISDYNSINPIKDLIDIPVIVDGNYEPTYGTNTIYPVRIQLKNRFDNYRKLYC